MNNNIVAIKILGRTYRIKCPPEQAYELQQSAEQLDREMRQLKQTTHINSTESLAIITALNLCNECMQLKKEKNQHIESTQQRIEKLQKRIEDFLETKEEVAV